MESVIVDRVGYELIVRELLQIADCRTRAYPRHAYGALKGRPRVLRTVGHLFRLTRGSTRRSIRERVEFLKLACLIGRLLDSARFSSLRSV